jgi:glycosyltransferase involved in cell wall biosynthesis
VTVVTTDALDINLFWDPSVGRIENHEDEIDGVRVLRFPVRHLPAPALSYAALRRMLWLASTLRLPPALARTGAQLTPYLPALSAWLGSTSERFDVIGTTTICFEGLIDTGARFARRTGAPHLVYPLTHLGAGERPGADALSRFYTMRHQVELVRQADCAVAMTAAERNFYVSEGADAERVSVMGSAIDPVDVLGGDAASFRERHGLHSPIVASLSAMMADKGTTHLVEAVRRLWREDRHVDLVLAGAIMPEFHDFLAALPKADRNRLRLLGPISNAEKRDFLAAADIFAMPSRTDSFGIVYLEAWLYGKPVIGARTWGVMDVIDDGIDGLLVPFGDAQQLAGALASLLDDPARRAAMGEAGRAKVWAEHTWEKKFPRVEALYRAVVQGRRQCAS